MEQSVILKAHVQVKRIYTLLTETLDISRQLAEALDRNDQVTVQMLIAMRGEPINKLRLAQAVLQEQKMELSPEDGQRLAELLNGEPAKEEAEEAIAAQVKMNERLLQQVLELDRVLNRKVAREKSFYQ